MLPTRPAAMLLALLVAASATATMAAKPQCANCGKDTEPPTTCPNNNIFDANPISSDKASFYFVNDKITILVNTEGAGIFYYNGQPYSFKLPKKFPTLTKPNSKNFKLNINTKSYPMFGSTSLVCKIQFRISAPGSAATTLPPPPPITIPAGAQGDFNHVLTFTNGTQVQSGTTGTFLKRKGQQLFARIGVREAAGSNKLVYTDIPASGSFTWYIPRSGSLGTGCMAGTGGDKTQGKCTPCPAGTAGDMQPTCSACTACSGNTVSAGPGATACITCPTNSTPNANKTACVCDNPDQVWNATTNACEGGPPAPVIAAGFFWNGTAAVPCPVGTFMPIERKQTTALACWQCASLAASDDRNPATGEVYTLLAVGTTEGATTCDCPANTYYIGSEPDATNPAFACARCPLGSTSGAAGATDVAQCQSQCKGGYYGNPALPQYGGECKPCPKVTPGDAASATTGSNAAPVMEDLCTVCSLGSDILPPPVGPPPACKACPAGAGGADCKQCVAGFFGTNGTCTKCPAEWDSSAAPALVDGDVTVCGGCAAGKTGPACADACPALTGTLPGVVYVLPLTPTTGADNCIAGCPPGWGLNTDGSACEACPAGSASPGTRIKDTHPVCLTCPTGFEPADGASRCKKTGAAEASGADEDGLFDEFD